MLKRQKKEHTHTHTHTHSFAEFDPLRVHPMRGRDEGFPAAPWHHPILPLLALLPPAS